MSALSAHQLGKIHQGDCVAGMNRLPAGSVDLAFADPPFNIGYEYDVYQDKKEHENYLDWSREWIGAVHRVLKPDGTFWLAIGDEYAAELKIASQEIGFTTRSWVIWYYTFGVNCKAKFSRSHAHLFHFVKDPAKFTFRSDELENRIPSARYLVYGDSRANPNGRLPDDTWILRPQDLSDRFTPDEDTWYFPRVAGTFKERAGFHGCQMPEQLLGRIIRVCSAPGETVLDPFSGSATTLAVAKKLGRQFLGFELSADYVARGTARLKDVCVGDALDGAVEPTMSAPVTVKPRSKTAKISPLESIVETASVAQEEKSQALVQGELIEAFRAIHEGYSLDRVVADPQLSAALVEECNRRGLPGDIRWWNKGLLALRKAGKFIPTGRRTELTWQDCDSFLFASEIAWQEMLDQGLESLDDILCDPYAATEFDRIAGTWAPGFTPLEYRWGALKLRKAESIARSRARRLTQRITIAGKLDLDRKDGSGIPERPGAFLIGNEGRKPKLYAGAANNLRAWFERNLLGDALERWSARASHLGVRYLLAPDAFPKVLEYPSLWIRNYNTSMNLRKLAAK